MLWNKEDRYAKWPYQKESELEDAVNEVKSQLFGSSALTLRYKILSLGLVLAGYRRLAHQKKDRPSPTLF